MKRSLITASLVLIISIAYGQVNYSEHIAPIIYENCSGCHRTGEIGPMPLTNYEQVRDWSAMIKYVTAIKYMPPWKASPDYSSFLGERYLSDEQIQLIEEWVDNGSPQGDPSHEPDFPNYPTGSQVGEPDLVLSFEQAFEHQGGNQDDYRIFVLPTNLTEDKDIATIELRPGNGRIVHHALFSYDDLGIARQLDEQDHDYGYDGFGGFGFIEAFYRQFPGYVPGQKPRLYPEGLGQKLPAGSDILVQMHYAPIPVPEKDSSTVNVFFKKEPVQRYVRDEILLPFGGTLVNGPFVIPGNSIRTFHGIWNITQDISVLNISPHMHLLGTKWRVFAVSAEGDTTNLIKIEDWDFNWQGTYHFDRFQVLKAGTKVHALATYDNTINNPLNPNNPPQVVSWGERTTDEMYYLPISYVTYSEGDENVVFSDGTTSDDGGTELYLPQNKLYPVFPNPGVDEINIGFSRSSKGRVSIRVVDLTGKLVQEVVRSEDYFPGRHQIMANLGHLPSGSYLIHMTTNEGYSGTVNLIII